MSICECILFVAWASLCKTSVCVNMSACQPRSEHEVHVVSSVYIWERSARGGLSTHLWGSPCTHMSQTKLTHRQKHTQSLMYLHTLSSTGHTLHGHIVHYSTITHTYTVEGFCVARLLHYDNRETPLAGNFVGRCQGSQIRRMVEMLANSQTAAGLSRRIRGLY